MLDYIFGDGIRNLSAGHRTARSDFTQTLMCQATSYPDIRGIMTSYRCRKPLNAQTYRRPFARYVSIETLLEKRRELLTLESVTIDVTESCHRQTEPGIVTVQL
jgi:hypothetical protein